jgi:hypothetical protein
MRAWIKNRSSLPRNGSWTHAFGTPLQALPFPSGVGTFVADDGRRFPVVRGEDVGTHSATYRMRVTMGGKEKLGGTLVDEYTPLSGQHYHRWVTDDLAANVPIATLFNPQTGEIQDIGDHGGIPLAGPQKISSSAAHERWFARGANAALGLIQEWYWDICHDDPAIHLWTSITWSDRRDPKLTRVHRGLFGLVSGEQLALHFMTRHGWRYDEFNGKKVVLIAQDPGWKDGGSIPARGYVLCYKGPGGGPWTPDGEDERDVKNLLAAKGGPIRVVIEGWQWDGKWLAAGNVPKPPQRGFSDMPPDVFDQIMQQPANLFVDRPSGCAKSPGQTGSQEDFAATKGSRALLFWDPDSLEEKIYSVDSDHFRGNLHFERNGSPLNPGNHPQLVTWGGDVHYDKRVSPDRLDKTEEILIAGPMGDWHDYDDEHRSQLNKAAVLALTGDPLLTVQWLQHTAVDVMSYAARFSAVMALRAEGRCAHTWANMALLLPDQGKRNAEYLLNQRVALWAQHPLLSVAGPMKTLAYHGPDGRKPIFDAQGNLVRTMTVWEIGLYLVGAISLLRSGKATDQAALQRVVLEMCRTIARYGSFQSSIDGRWNVVGDVEYRDGADVPIADSTFTPGVGYKYTTFDANAGDVRSWTMVGIIGAEKLLRENTSINIDDLGLADKCFSAMQAFGIDLNNPPTQEAAEWWAVVRS